MIILLIDVNYKNSSTGKIVHQLKNYLTKTNDIVPYVAYGRGINIKEKNVYKFSIDTETKVHALLTRISGLTGFFSPLSTLNLIRYMRRIKPDVIHIHEIHGYFVNWMRIVKYAIKHNVRVVWTFHCDFMITGRCGVSNECTRWKKGCGKCPDLKKYPRSLMLDFSRLMYNQKKNNLIKIKDLCITTPSKWLSDKVSETYLKHKRIEVVPNGIDTEVFKPRRDRDLDFPFDITKKRVLLFVAPNPFSEQKGGKYALTLAKDLTHYNTYVIIIGDDIKSPLFKDSYAILPKIMDQEMLANYYSLAEFTLILSKTETFSLVTAESLACGTPVIGFDSLGPSEIALKGMGLFVKYGDYEGLKSNIIESLTKKKRFLSNDLLVTHIIKNYSIQAMVNNYVKLYRGD